MKIDIYTDGSADNNAGDGSPGGWGVVFTSDQGHYREKSGVIQHPDARPTNQQMELLAVTKALWGIKPSMKGKIESITIHTDSQYACTMALARKAEANRFIVEEMWDAIKEAKKIAPVKVVHIPGHAGHEHQERAHTLAFKAYRDALTSSSSETPSGQAHKDAGIQTPAPDQEESPESKQDRAFREKMERDREYKAKLARQAEAIVDKLDPEVWGQNAINLVKLLRDPAARFYPYLSDVPGDEPRVRVRGQEAWLRSVVGDKGTIIFPHKRVWNPRKKSEDKYEYPTVEFVDFSWIEPITERNTGV